MNLISLRMHNFRQFLGTTPEIQFASGTKNVTVLFGTNGAGKTAMLNAFTWTLYDTTTRGFLFPGQIVNKAALRQAKPGDTIDAWVEIKFDHLGKKYVLRKTHSVIRTQNEAEVINRDSDTKGLQWAGEDGQWRTESSISDVIGRILPIDLHTYFFFDGERIERLVQPTKEEQADISNATRKLLGIEILERASRHLSNAKRSLEKELEAIGDPETVKLLKEKTEIEIVIHGHAVRASELNRNLEGHHARKDELEKRLRELHEVKSVQERRDQLNRDSEARKTALFQTGQNLSNLISSRGYSVFIEPASVSYRSLIDGLRQRGELPAGIKRQFVDDLLHDALCICDRSLREDVAPDARSAVERWKGRAGLADVEEKAIRMGGEVKQLEIGIEEFWKLLDQYEQKRTADRQELARVEEELEGISEKLRNSPKEEISGLEEALKKTQRAMEADVLEQATANAAIKQQQHRLTEIEHEIARHQGNEARQQLAQRRVNAAYESLSRIEESRARFETMHRAALLKKVRHLFDIVSYTPYVPDITDGYALRLLESAGGAPLPVAASQGESQILSLCFIGAMIDLAREYHSRKEKLPGPNSSVYPLVMDSPFGSLGPTYRHQVADHISVLADQVVIMVTNTQWRGEVEESLKGRIGNSYVLEYFSPKEKIERETVDMDGQTFDLIRQSPNDFEYTQVQGVRHA